MQGSDVTRELCIHRPALNKGRPVRSWDYCKGKAADPAGGCFCVQPALRRRIRMPPIESAAR